MAEPADLNLDELKRRGRRRLIGAIVLALVAAVGVPMLLESEPRPLGEDVSVRIPPVDDGKFVNKLSEPRPKADGVKSAPDATTKDATGAAPRKSLVDAEKSVITPGARTAAVEPKAPAASAKAPETTVADATTASPPPGAKAEAPREGYVVQLAAFSDDKGANSLANKLKRAGYAAYTESLQTSRGTLWRVRVGPFASRDTAAQSRDRLKGEGHAGIVVPAK
jgi:DedD protein